jgi:hypothetical protein
MTVPTTTAQRVLPCHRIQSRAASEFQRASVDCFPQRRFRIYFLVGRRALFSHPFSWACLGSHLDDEPDQAGGIVELAFAVMGSQTGEIDGFTSGWVVAAYVEAVFIIPTILRAIQVAVPRFGTVLANTLSLG